MSRDEPSGVITRQIGRFLPSLFLVSLLVLGGASREAFLANGVLQVISVFVILWCLFDTRMQKFTPAAWWFIGFALTLLLITLLQLAPLPPDIWSRLPGREQVADAFTALNLPLPWLPVSMAPEATVYGALKFLPPLAAFFIAAKAPWRTLSAYLPWVIVIVATFSVLIGVGQVLGGRSSPLYVHAITNWGSPVGFMANANHQASFLLMALPFSAVLAGRLFVRAEVGDADIGQGVMLATLIIGIALGVAIAGSLAGYALGIPAILLSLLTMRSRSGLITIGVVAVVAVGVALVGLVAASSPNLTGLGVTSLSDGSLSRPDTYARTIEAIKDVVPVGSGLGSFEALFPRYENPSLVTGTFMNHVHNDYLELILEYGIFGVALIAAALVWLVLRIVAVWREKGGDNVRIRKAASIALLIVILHSLVDYPLRTPAVAGFAGICLGLLVARAEVARRRSSPVDEAQEEAPRAQHVVI